MAEGQRGTSAVAGSKASAVAGSEPEQTEAALPGAVAALGAEAGPGFEAVVGN